MAFQFQKMKGENTLYDKPSNDYNKATKVIECDIDELFEQCGSTGYLQKIVQISTFYIFMASVFNMIFSYFTGIDPPWRCFRNSSSHFCRTHYNQEISTDSKLFTERCKLHRDEWEYTTAKLHSFVTEFDLVCGNTFLAAIISSSFYVGGLLGAILTGPISDTYGRINVMLVASILTTVSSVISSYATYIWQLISLNITRGAGVTSLFFTTIVYQSEFFSPSYRALANNILLLGANASFLLITLLANYVRNWRHLHTFAALPSILVVVILFIMPESPRWYLAVGKKKEAEDLVNRIKISEEYACYEIRLRSPKIDPEKKYTYLDLICHFQVFKLTATVVLLWVAIPVLYYSIALESSNLGGNIYEAFALSTVAELPSFMITPYLCNNMGRKLTTVTFLMLGGIVTGSMIFVPRDYSHRFAVNMTLAIVSKFFISICFNSVYTWSLEIFPTILRTQGMSLCAILDRLSLITVPFIITVLQRIMYTLPDIILCALGLGAGLIGLRLPETNKKPTKETYDDFLEH